MPLVVEPTIVCPQGSLGWLDKLLIAVWRGSSMESADIFYHQMQAGIDRHGSGLSHLAVIEPGSSTPTPPVRKRIAAVFNEHPNAITAVSVVFVGQGFFAATVGSVATAIMLLAQRAFPFRVYSDLGDAAHFLDRHMELEEPGLTSDALADAVRVLRERLYAPPTSYRPSPP